MKEKQKKKERKLINQNVAKVLTALGTILAVLFGMVAVLSVTGIHWMFKTWNNLSMEELMFHIQAPLEGTNTDMIWDFFWSSGIYVLIISVCLIVLFILLRRRENVFYILMISTVVCSLIASGLSVKNAWDKLEISSYISNTSEYSTFIDDNYVDPRDVEILFPEKKRNLIYIFLESMESSYADKKSGGLFEKNVIPELTQLAVEGECFSGDKAVVNGGVPMVGTTWTIGAMVGQTSGFPLKVPEESNNEMDKQDYFAPGLITIGDILEKEGYCQELLIGSDANFGGRKQYFTEHGNYKIFDYNYAKEIKKIHKDYYVWWGYEDKRLFQYAKEELETLSANDEPFNFTMLTVDTHFEDGYVCEECDNNYGKDQYSNVFACSSKKVDEFVKWVQQQDFYENTTIVIAGDHLTMDSDYCKDINNNYDRKAFLSIINAPVNPENNIYRTYTTFDNFPTTLASLGVQIEGNRLGLGTNLFSSEKSLAERYGYERQNDAVAKNSKLAEKMYGDLKTGEELAAEEAELEQQSVTADVEVLPYDYRTGKFSVNVFNLNNAEGVKTIRCLVWPREETSKSVWTEAELTNEGIYVSNVYASDFAYQRGDYSIQVYAVYEDGTQVLISEILGNI